VSRAAVWGWERWPGGVGMGAQAGGMAWGWKGQPEGVTMPYSWIFR
jgi:hypothetical protein